MSRDSSFRNLSPVASLRPRFCMKPSNRSLPLMRADCLALSGNGGVIVSQKRSEEHTSELQSLMRISYAVFCSKKQKIQTRRRRTMTNNQCKLNETVHATNYNKLLTI